MGSIRDWVGRLLGGARPQAAASGIELNTLYDQQTAAVMQRVLERGSNCIDVGCHVGAILDQMLRFAPDGRHHAFEPLPHLYQGLEAKYRGNDHVRLHDVALAKEPGETTFQHVVSNPGYSGILRRRYDRPHEEVVEIRVKLARLDDLVPVDTPIRLVKVDVEGAEMGVFKGGMELLARCRPYVVFEHGLGAADFYGTRPEQVHDLFTGLGMKVSTMSDWLAGRAPLSRAVMAEQFDRGVNYYFMAHP